MIFYYIFTSIFGVVFFSFCASKWEDDRPDLGGLGGN